MTDLISVVYQKFANAIGEEQLTRGQKENAESIEAVRNNDLTHVDFLARFVNNFVSSPGQNTGAENEIKTYTFTPAPIFVSPERAYRNHAALLNITRPHRKISWRRLNRQQRATAIMNEVRRAYATR